MSRSTTHHYTCPCGQECSSPVYEYVHVGDDPLLRYVVLAGLINVSTCQHCGRKATVSTPFIYSDPEHGLLAYIHPRNDAPEEARLLILEKLRSVYVDIHQKQQKDQQPDEGGRMISLPESNKRELPPLQVVFGIDQLSELINGMLDPDEKLGRLALSTQSRNVAERGQFHDIARKLGSEMGCCIEVEDLPDEYTVWLYGSRRQIGALMRELAPR